MKSSNEDDGDRRIQAHPDPDRTVMGFQTGHDSSHWFPTVISAPFLWGIRLVLLVSWQFPRPVRPFVAALVILAGLMSPALISFIATQTDGSVIAVVVLFVTFYPPLVAVFFVKPLPSPESSKVLHVIVAIAAIAAKCDTITVGWTKWAARMFLLVCGGGLLVLVPLVTAMFGWNYGLLAAVSFVGLATLIAALAVVAGVLEYFLRERVVSLFRRLTGGALSGRASRVVHESWTSTTPGSDQITGRSESTSSAKGIGQGTDIVPQPTPAVEWPCAPDPVPKGIKR